MMPPLEARHRTSENSVRKLSEKGNEQRSDPVFSCIRSATRTEKYGFGLPHGYAVSASEAFKDEYDRYYGWASAFSHGHWGAVRDSVLQTCQNPLHRLHRIPRATRRTLEDDVHDACRLVDQVL